ncbi:hypothetical protein FHN55_02635 [Streptomyces sp. NP160]|uniref:hypothetical protein n=1 Tax=Streptomyces sp. NP160 TaxID=2586637 RepID=UPI001119C463|nr:hypothetical protein [Streptomyces sp. NP160]TNM69663.1 hypothetical protein FHN55_02635 [Streptomyces sp. NP160]
MASTSVSLLEARVAASLWWRVAAHPDGYELDPQLHVLGLEQQDEDDDEGASPADAAEPVTALADVQEEGPAGPVLLPEACLVGVRDQVALEWAARTPGVGLVTAVEELWADLATDLESACCPTDTAAADSTCTGVSDAELVEAVAACERQIAALAARRDQLAGVFASRRQAEAEADVAEARAASARDG